MAMKVLSQLSNYFSKWKGYVENCVIQIFMDLTILLPPEMKYLTEIKRELCVILLQFINHIRSWPWWLTDPDMSDLVSASHPAPPYDRFSAADGGKSKQLQLGEADIYQGFNI